MHFHTRSLARCRLLLALILLAGCALRLFRLGAESLWYDETVSVALAGSPVPELLRHTAGDIHPPGYYLLLRGWLLLSGYPTGRADPTGIGLEFMAAFCSLFCGVALIALAYVLARRLAGQPVALVAAALVAFSPYNVWYGQEVRMYTLGAGLGVLALYALWRAVYGRGSGRPGPHDPEGVVLPGDAPSTGLEPPPPSDAVPSTGLEPFPPIDAMPLTGRHGASRSMDGWAVRTDDAPHPQTKYRWWLVYAVVAAAGMATLYYFAFLLLPLSLWALAVLLRQRRSIVPWLLAHAAAVLLYAPWLPVAWRQATQPPVPPWRTAPALWPALRETWTALSLGQSAPEWLWPVLLLTLLLYVLGLRYLRGRAALPLCLATFGPLALILLISVVAAPLYHVRYVFTYSPAFYVVLAAGLVALGRRWRGLAWLAVLVWLVAAGITMRAFWFDPAFRADDHRSAVRQLQATWQPGDVALVNAGWAYTALTTYWNGPVLRSRLTEPLPARRDDADTLVLVTTGHVDGDETLGWADPQADFYSLPAEVASEQIPALYEHFPRLWHYRIYDTVNDPAGVLRDLLAEGGQLVDDRQYAGEAFLRVQEFVPADGTDWQPDAPGAQFGDVLDARWDPLVPSIASGDTLYTAVSWQPARAMSTTLATSLRLIGADGQLWAQAADEQPLGPLFLSTRWPAGVAQRQPLALPVPEGVPPGQYAVMLVAYDANTGEPLAVAPVNGAEAAPPGVLLGRVTVQPSAPPPPPRPAVAEFGPVGLITATTPATTVSPGSTIPVELLWQMPRQIREGQAQLVTVVQLLGPDGTLAANLETEMRCGDQPSAAGQLLREHHALVVPPDLPPGPYRLIVGVYTLPDRTRLMAGNRDHYPVGGVLVTGR